MPKSFLLLFDGLAFNLVNRTVVTVIEVRIDCLYLHTKCVLLSVFCCLVMQPQILPMKHMGNDFCKYKLEVWVYRVHGVTLLDSRLYTLSGHCMHHYSHCLHSILCYVWVGLSLSLIWISSCCTELREYNIKLFTCNGHVVLVFVHSAVLGQEVLMKVQTPEHAAVLAVSFLVLVPTRLLFGFLHAQLISLLLAILLMAHLIWSFPMR